MVRSVDTWWRNGIAVTNVLERIASDECTTKTPPAWRRLVSAAFQQSVIKVKAVDVNAYFHIAKNSAGDAAASPAS